MNPWFYFWTANFVIAGSAFAIVAAIVLVRGVGELRRMFKRLRQHREAGGS